MLFALAAIAFAFLLALVVLRFAAIDYDRTGELSRRSGLFVWLLYLAHADSVVAAAYAAELVVPVPRALAMAVGVPIGVAGFVLFLWSAVALARSIEQGGTLVTAGPFAVSRHPQNMGWTLLLLGIALAARSPLAVALVLVFMVFIHRLAILEERHLSARFGAAYAGYRDRTPRLLRMPMLRSTTRSA
jgi:protein-S-isoprenylcysteine O-methyltransferase Ste14